MPSPLAPLVAVAVVSWNTRVLLDDCLTSLAPDASGGLAEVIVVDNASSDGSAEMVAERHPWATLIRLSENVGFGPAVNRAVARSTAPWVAPANADIHLGRDALRSLIRVGDADPRIGIVAPRLVLDDGSTQHSVYAFPTLTFTLLFNLGIAGAVPALADRLALEGRWNPDRPREVAWAIGAFLLVRRAAWDAVGGFDERQWMYAEDLDLGWRIRRAGYATRYEPSAIVRHRGSAATQQVWGEQREAQWLRSTYAWMFRRRGIAITRAVALVNIAGAAARATALSPLATLRPGRWGPRRRDLWGWARLHRVGLSSRRQLERHR